MTRLIFALAILLVLTTTSRAENLEYCYKGKGARDGGNNDLAIEYFTLCIDDGNLTEETRATVFYIRGNAYSSKREYDQAIADFTQAIRLRPDSANAFGNRGTAYYLKGHYDQAIADFTQAIRLRPKDALAFNNRGSAYDDRTSTRRSGSTPTMPSPSTTGASHTATGATTTKPSGITTRPSASIPAMPAPMPTVVGPTE
jgi:tetratricopeptide (TPR) repeat protein